MKGPWLAKNDLRSLLQAPDRPTMKRVLRFAAKTGWCCAYLVRINLPRRVACRRYVEPLWLMATVF